MTKILRFTIILIIVFTGNLSAKESKIIMPVNIYVVNMNFGKFQLTYSDEIKKNIEKDFEYVNNIWSEAGFFWKIKKIKPMKANIKRKEFLEQVDWLEKNYNSGSVTRPKILKRIRLLDKIINFKKSYRSRAVNVYYFPEMLVSKKCGTTIQYSDKFRKNVIVGFKNCNYEKSGIPGRAIALAHEFGHVFELKHRGTEGHNLMIKGGGTIITKAEKILIKRYYNDNYKNYYK